jgi:NAD-dependent deacetylase
MYEGKSPYDLASPEGFRADPVMVWNWYAMRIRNGISAQPNPGHVALRDMESISEHVAIVTSNVDELHERAGSTSVYHLHGRILETLCTECARVDPLDVGALGNPISGDSLPACACGGLLRPNVVWFGEYPWQDAIDAVTKFLPLADIVLEVGHSGTVSYGFPEGAVGLGIPVVRINVDPLPPLPNTLDILEGAEIALPRLIGMTKL